MAAAVRGLERELVRGVLRRRASHAQRGLGAAVGYLDRTQQLPARELPSPALLSDALA